MRQIEYSGQFKRDLKKSKKRGKNIELIKELGKKGLRLYFFMPKRGF